MLRVSRLFRRRKEQDSPPAPEKTIASLDKKPLPPSPRAALKALQSALGNSHDVISREAKIGGKIVIVEIMVQKKEVEELLRVLLLERPQVEQAEVPLNASLKRWQDEGIPVGSVHGAATVGAVIIGLLNGKTCLLGQGWSEALLVDTRGWEKRAISEPLSESAVRGPREGFVENIATNISLIRRRLRHPNLRIEKTGHRRDYKDRGGPSLPAGPCERKSFRRATAAPETYQDGRHTGERVPGRNDRGSSLFAFP
ncbi:MAG: spore germination protein, partial [Firmicutes bacterium]|nr:spore germination protein [Bacillota bacterium]